MTVRFIRYAEVVIASEIDPTKKDSETRFFNAFTKQTQIKDLWIRFHVEKTLSKDPNSATIRIANLAEKTRVMFEASTLHLTLNAGYVGDVKTLYKGDIVSTRTYREGANLITEITCGTGANARHAHSSFSVGNGTTKGNVVEKLLGGMGLKVPTTFAESKTAVQQIVSGKAFHGPTLGQVQGAVAPDYRVSIQDDKVVILEENGTRFASGTRIEQSTGMIGIPILSSPSKKGGKPTLEVKTLLNGELQAGGFVQLRTDTVNGDYGIGRIVHSGDTFGQEWYSSVEGQHL